MAGTNSAYMYDPKSGENVTDFIDTFSDDVNGLQYFQMLKYLNEFHYMLVSTSRRQLLVYKYNPSGSLTLLRYKQPLDSICYTSKQPILLFTGDSNGCVCKWEQQQLNHLVYANETLLKSELAPRESSKLQGQQQPTQQQQQSKQQQQQQQKQKQQQQQQQQQQQASKSNGPFGDTGGGDGEPIKKTKIISKLIYNEKLDYLLGACEDGSIYVWGFDQEAVKILKNMKYNEETSRLDDNNINELRDYFGRADTGNNNNNNNQDEEIDADAVTNRVAGYVLKKVLCEHNSFVSSLVIVNDKWLLSGGWDRRICIWVSDVFEILLPKKVLLLLTCTLL